jgi:hypothetical protein
MPPYSRDKIHFSSIRLPDSHRAGSGSASPISQQAPPSIFICPARNREPPLFLLVLTMQILAQWRGFGYFSNQYYCIFQYITDSIRLIPLCILLLPHLVCPEKSFFANTTLGVSHYETYHSRLRRRPGSHWCSCLHPDLLRLHPEQGHCLSYQHAAGPRLRSG